MNLIIMVLLGFIIYISTQNLTFLMLPAVFASCNLPNECQLIKPYETQDRYP